MNIVVKLYNEAFLIKLNAIVHVKISVQTKESHTPVNPNTNESPNTNGTIKINPLIMEIINPLLVFSTAHK